VHEGRDFAINFPGVEEWAAAEKVGRHAPRASRTSAKDGQAPPEAERAQAGLFWSSYGRCQLLRCVAVEALE